MDEVERDIENYQGRGWKPQASVDNANRGLDISGHLAKTEFKNFIIHMDCYQNNYLKQRRSQSKSRQDVFETIIFLSYNLHRENYYLQA